MGTAVPPWELASLTTPPLGICLFLLQVYPGQQYLPGGQYSPSTTQYAPGQPPAPSSFPGHRLPLPTSGPPGLHYKVGEASWACSAPVNPGRTQASGWAGEFPGPDSAGQPSGGPALQGPPAQPVAPTETLGGLNGFCRGRF